MFLRSALYHPDLELRADNDLTDTACTRWGQFLEAENF